MLNVENDNKSSSIKDYLDMFGYYYDEEFEDYKSTDKLKDNEYEIEINTKDKNTITKNNWHKNMNYYDIIKQNIEPHIENYFEKTEIYNYEKYENNAKQENTKHNQTNGILLLFNDEGTISKQKEIKFNIDNYDNKKELPKIKNTKKDIIKKTNTKTEDDYLDLNEIYKFDCLEENINTSVDLFSKINDTINEYDKYNILLENQNYIKLKNEGKIKEETYYYKLNEKDSQTGDTYSFTNEESIASTQINQKIYKSTFLD